MIVYNPPIYPNIDGGEPALFLAGSIDMGSAVDWQKEVIDALSDLKGTIYNPRRDDWDPSWDQDISNEPFRKQVEWELDHLQWASIICFYFDPNGPAPITLLELGLSAKASYFGTHVVVCCPKGYWRRGNVAIVCQRHGIDFVETLDEMIANIRGYVLDVWP